MEKDLKDIIREYLHSEDRINHSYRVAELAKDIAKHYGISSEKAYTAGILHDIAKEYTFEKSIITAREHNYTLSESEILNKKLLHAPIGALIIEHELHINDKDIIEAIHWHTTGKTNMSLLEKIIFIADKAESGRKYPEAQIMKDLVFQDINKTMIIAVKYSMNRLIETERFIDKQSLDCYNHLISTVNN